jgi:hypothetical protein
MIVHRAELVFHSRVPHLQDSVFASGGDQGEERVPVDRCDV